MLGKVSFEFVKEVNRAICLVLGKNHNVIDEFKIKSALSPFDNNYDDERTTIAKIFRNLIIAHGFEDANKRTACIILYALLPPKCSEEELEDIAVSIANGEYRNNVDELVNRLYGDSINESVGAEKIPITYDDIEITTYDFKHQSKETGDVPSHTFKTHYTYYADIEDIADYIFENHFYDLFDEEYYEIADDSDFEDSYEHIKKNIDYYYNMFEDEIKEYFREKATEEANESEDWEEVERNRFTYDEAVSLNEEKPEYVDYNGEQRRLYKLSKTNKKTGEKSTRYFVKDKDYEPLTQDNTDINANVPNRVNFVGYKQFKTLYNPNDPSTEKYKGLLFPLFVGAKQKDGIEIGKWYRCGTGELRIEVDRNGKPVPGGAIQVDSKLGNLAYRPGWHLSSAPVTRHIGVGASRSNDNHNDYGAMYSENVWAKVEYSAHYDFTEKAKQMPGADKDPKKEMFTDKNEIKNGFYHYRTNSNADDTEDWLIADAIKVLSVLSDETVRKIANEHGLQAQDRWTADGTSGNAFVADFSQFSVVENMRR